MGVNGATWRFRDGTPNAHSRCTSVLTAARLKQKLAELLQDDRGQEVQVVVWEKNGAPASYWITRDEARRLTDGR